MTLNQFYIRTISVCALLLGTIIEINAQDGDVVGVHDPCIIKQDSTYYIFSTSTWGTNGIPMRQSNDLINWEYIGAAFDTVPAWAIEEVPGAKNIWAPDIFYHNNTYYLYYSVSTFGSNTSTIGLATNTTLNPSDTNYQWVDQGKVISSKSNIPYNNYNAIDPNIIEDDSGRIWLSFGSFWSGIKQVELDTTTMKPKSAYPVPSALASRYPSTAIEAPFIVHKNGFYYLFASIDFCCRGTSSTYKIIVGRSTEVTGPYFDASGKNMKDSGGTLILEGDDRWSATGHNAVLLDENADWLVYHAYDSYNNGWSTLQIRSLEWSDDNWPIAGDIINNLEIDDSAELPTDFVLYQNYPNPFNFETKIRYKLMKSSWVNISIYNIQGKLVTTLVEGYKNSGSYSVIWDGKSTGSGLYIYKIAADNFIKTKKMILLK